ncbi:MAG TPA: AI-2E family transporter [Bacillales bacterium]|nr:AI-2E family transporter [Bacillales bacterium]
MLLEGNGEIGRNYVKIRKEVLLIILQTGGDVPLVNERWFRIGVGSIMVFILIWLINADKFVFTPFIIFIQTLFLPFLIAGLLFYLIRPLIEWMERWRVPRKVGILVVFLVIAGVITLIVNMLVPIIQSQFTRLVNNLPYMIDTVQQAIAYWKENQDSIPDFVVQAVQNAGNKLQAAFSSASTSIGGLLSSFVGFLFSLVVVPFILFYLLDDHGKFVPSLVRFFPKSRHNDIRRVLTDMDSALGSYIQGQLIVSSCVGFMLFIGYLVIGLDYALLLALFGMVTNVIPFLGPFLAVTPAVIAAFFQDPIMVFYVAVVMIIAQQVESNLISPQVMGRALNAHPLTIILLILVGGNLAGVLGMVLIIPTYAVLKVIVQHVYRLFTIKQSENKDSSQP